ncbi:MAG: hypothetical protein Q9160_005840 [Pyrenula sp. 1 TL-2023]
MTFPFSLPTTSHLLFPTHLSSSTHPSLPASASSHREILRSALKTHKRLASTEQSTHLFTVLSALESYLPFLFALDNGLSARTDIQIAPFSDISVEWRPTLSSTNVPGRETPRVKGTGLSYEIYSSLQTLATVHNLLARQQLLTLYSPTAPPDSTARLTAIQTALKNLLTANSIHNYLLQRSQSQPPSPPLPTSSTDLSPSLQSSLSSLSLASTTLLFVLKDDPYPPVVLQSHSKTDKEWMIAAPSIPKVRAHLFARLCVAASDHAAAASAGLLSDPKVSSELRNYCSDLAKTAKAKACRFLGIDADVAGRTGEAIAWLRAAKCTLDPSLASSFSIPSQSPSPGGKKFTSLKSSLSSAREDRRIARGASDWGLDAGKHEEMRILDWLERKWVKMNDTVNVQLVPELREVVKNMPSGREGLERSVWKPPEMDGGELGRMRAVGGGGGGDGTGFEGESSGDDLEQELGVGDGGSVRRGPVGAFPGTKDEYEYGYDDGRGNGGTSRSERRAYF